MHENAHKSGAYKGQKVYGVFKPKFSGGEIGGVVYKDFTTHPNYYKMLEDFSTYDGDTPSMQGAVTLTYPSKENALKGEQLEPYKAKLRDTGIFTEAEIEKYAKGAQMSLEELIEKEMRSRQAYNAKQDAVFDETVDEVVEMLETDFARDEAFQFSENDFYDYTKSFAEQIDDWKACRIPVRDALLVGGTPKAFRDIGLAALPMAIGQGHTRTAITGIYKGKYDADHHIGEAVLKDLPNLLEHPIAIIASESKPDSSIVAIVNKRHNGKEIIAAVEIEGFGNLNNKRVDANAITTVFAKTNAVTKLLKDALDSHARGHVSVFMWDKN